MTTKDLLSLVGSVSSWLRHISSTFKLLWVPSDTWVDGSVGTTKVTRCQDLGSQPPHQRNEAWNLLLYLLIQSKGALYINQLLALLPAIFMFWMEQLRKISYKSHLQYITRLIIKHEQLSLEFILPATIYRPYDNPEIFCLWDCCLTVECVTEVKMPHKRLSSS